jgi:uncharacterized phage protein (TIGR01671 family)
MREILFRGKLNHSKEWVQGSLIISQWGNPYIYPNDIIEQDGHHIRFDSDAPFFVIPETVGQFIGKTDKNNVKIFEGDIITDKYGRKSVIKWSNILGGFIAEFVKPQHNGIQTYTLLSARGMAEEFLEVIGNIHDNPELLEGVI